MDEKGFSLGVARGRNIRLIVPVHVSQPGSREWVMLDECVSVEGSHIPAFYIYPGKGDNRHAQFKDVEKLDPDTRYPPPLHPPPHHIWAEIRPGIRGAVDLRKAGEVVRSRELLGILLLC